MASPLPLRAVRDGLPVRMSARAAAVTTAEVVQAALQKHRGFGVDPSTQQRRLAGVRWITSHRTSRGDRFLVVTECDGETVQVLLPDELELA